MTDQDSNAIPPPSRGATPTDRSSSPASPPSPSRPSPPGPPHPPRPWRTEGLPDGQPPKPRSRWKAIIVGLIGYVVVFGVLTLQDRLAGPQVAIPYTELKAQVEKKNVSGVFARGDSIEGELKSPAPLPASPDKPGGAEKPANADKTYRQFTTERPTF